jgi:hypothetical protein
MPLGKAPGEEPDQLGERAREVLVGERVGGSAQGAGGHPVGPRGAADAEVDAPRMKGLEHPELLGDDERRVVRQHHAAGADPDPLSGGGERRRQHRGRRARDPRHVVVLGDPVAVIAESLGDAGEVDRVDERLGRARALADDGEIEHGDRDASGGHISSLAA